MRGVLGVHGAHGGRALHAGRRSHAGFPRAFSAEASASIGFPGVFLWMPLSSYRNFPGVIRDSLEIFGINVRRGDPSPECSCGGLGLLRPS